MSSVVNPISTVTVNVPRQGAHQSAHGGSVTIENVMHRYGNTANPVTALSSVNLSIAPGEFLSLLGPSGCGKSTLLKIVAGLIRPTHGTITIDGNAVLAPSRDVGLMFQRPVLLPWRRILANVLFPADARGLNRRALEPKARELLARVGLAGFENHFPAELSVGMQQRVALCRALLFDERVLLMDEPFAALDALSRDKNDVDLSRITTASGATTIFVTHSIQEAVLISDRIIVMSARPARVVREFTYKAPRPRDLKIQEDAEFSHLVGAIRAALEEEAA